MFTSSLRRFFIQPNFTKTLLKSNQSFTQSALPFAASLKRSFADISKPAVGSAKSSSQPNADQLIRADENLNTYMSRIYNVTGFSFAGTLATSYAIAATTVITQPLAVSLVVAGSLLNLAGITGMRKISTKTVIEKLPKGKTREKIQNPFSRKLAYSAVILGSGIAAAPLVQVVAGLNLSSLLVAAGISILTMGGASMYSLYKPLGAFKNWEATLFSGLFGLVSINILSLLAHLMIGPNPFSYIWMNAEMYIGIGLFTGYQAFDTHKAIQAFKEGKIDHLDHALSFFLNIQNLFIRYLEILAKANQRSK